MNKIKYLQNEVNAIKKTLDELSKLETYENADYSEIQTDLEWLHQMLKHRVITLKNRRQKK